MAKALKKRIFPAPAKTIPLDVGTIHFVGVGGIGMSGMAEILHNLGYTVSGSDISENANVTRLRAMGIHIDIGHEKENVEAVSVVVKSTAVPMDNVEIAAAREQNIPVVRRSEMLAELTRLKATIAVAGTHGKTTTTSIIATMMQGAGLDPTIINGGIINSLGTNAKVGNGDWLVVEADESDGTFIKIPSTIGVVTNIEPEHLDFYDSFDAIREAFLEFIQRLPFYGVAVLCYDHPEVRSLMDKLTDRRILTYGLEQGADIRAENIRHSVDGSTFDVHISENILEGGEIIKDMFLAMPGQHNIQNCLSAIAIAHVLSIDSKEVQKAFKSFGGVKRRFSKVGEVNGITIIDDYGHHPTEISATLATAREVQQKGGKVIAVVQPHRYSRLKHLFEEFCGCFGDADKVIVTDVYAAGEKPLDGASKEALVEALRVKGIDAFGLDSDESLAKAIHDTAKENDLVVCLGAGSISLWANALPEELKKLS